MRNFFARYLTVLALVGMGGFCYADEFVVPVQKIEVNSGVGGEIVPLGEVVQLNISNIEKKPDFLNREVVSWKVYDGGKEKFFFKKDDKTIYFGTGIKSRTLKVFAAVSYLYIKTNEDKSQTIEVKNVFLTKDVVIGDPDNPAPPEPGPNPEPKPEPVLPDGKYKLAKSVYDLGKSNSAAGAQALAKSFRGMASKYAAVNMSLTDFLTGTTAANKQALADAKVSDVDKWDAFGTAFQDVIFNLYKNGTVRTKEDFIAAWNEIATGLEAIK